MDWWDAEIGHMRLDEVEQDHIYFALERLSGRNARYWAGRDADGKPIFKSKNKPYAPATINRYAATIGALLTWCVKKRLPPKGWEHPCRWIERLPENNEIVRFLSDEERVNLLDACRQSKWSKLYLLVLMAITTGARRGELENLRWSAINFDRQEAAIELTKNGVRKVLLIKSHQGHHPSYRNLQFFSRVRSMPMRANVAARLNGVEQTLAGILVTLVNVTVLTKPWADFGLACQIIQILGVKNFHRVTRLASGR